MTNKVSIALYDKDQVDALLADKVDTSDLSAVAISGDYDDLTNKPTIPAAQIQANWNEADTTSMAYIQNKPTIPSAITITDNSTYYTMTY